MCRVLQRLYFKYELVTGALVFEPWEKALIALLYLGIVALVTFAIYRQFLLLSSLVFGK